MPRISGHRVIQTDAGLVADTNSNVTGNAEGGYVDAQPPAYFGPDDEVDLQPGQFGFKANSDGTCSIYYGDGS